MAKALFTFPFIFLLISCSGSSQTQQAEQSLPVETTEWSSPVTEPGSEIIYREATYTGEVNVSNRRVFYDITKTDGEYYIAKSVRFFIVDEQLMIVEIPHEPTNSAIRKIGYKGDSVISMSLNYFEPHSGYYYSDLLDHETFTLHETDPASEYSLTLKKDPSTYIWTFEYQGGYKREWIETTDVLSSGYRYQNQATSFHNPDTEDFRIVVPEYKGVFDLHEKPEQVSGTCAYDEIAPLFSGKWLELTMTDIGYVVYDYPDIYNDGETSSPIYIHIDSNILESKYVLDPAYPYNIENVQFYPTDESYLFDLGTIKYSFKIIDRENHICEWTEYHNKDIWNQHYYIHADHNSYPIIKYDWY